MTPQAQGQEAGREVRFVEREVDEEADAYLNEEGVEYVLPPYSDKQYLMTDSEEEVRIDRRWPAPRPRAANPALNTLPECDVHRRKGTRRAGRRRGEATAATTTATRRWRARVAAAARSWRTCDSGSRG